MMPSFAPLPGRTKMFLRQNVPPQAKGAVIVESSALAFNALSSLPGPYIGAFVGKIGAAGLFTLLADFEDKTAVAEHRVAFSAGPGAPPKVWNA